MPSPTPTSKFVFNPNVSDNAYVTERRKEAEKLEALLADLKERVVICQMPIFTNLVNWFPPDISPKEIQVLGKALVKYAEIKPRLSVLNKELNIIDDAKANSDLLAIAFGDSESFQKELESIRFENE